MTVTDITVPEAAHAAGAADVEAFGERIFGEALGAVHLLSVELGLRTGLFAALQQGAADLDEIVRRTGLDRRYVEEWLQAEVLAGLVLLEGDAVAGGRFSLAPGVGEGLLSETSPAYVGAMPALPPATASVLDALTAAFRTGAGVPYAEYGPEAVTVQGAFNRPAHHNALVQEWLPAIPDVLARLADPTRPARVADIGCGVGWSSIALARAFPHVTIDAYDNDAESIRRARANAAAEGVEAAIDFEVKDASADPYAPGRAYDVIFLFECLHDFAFPKAALAAARAALADGGAVIVMDERVDDELGGPGDPIQLFFALASVVWCLPQSRVEPGAEPTGTMLRPSVLTALAREAGFAQVDVLPIEHPFWRFYRLAG